MDSKKQEKKQKQKQKKTKKNKQRWNNETDFLTIHTYTKDDARLCKCMQIYASKARPYTRNAKNSCKQIKMKTSKALPPQQFKCMQIYANVLSQC